MSGKNRGKGGVINVSDKAATYVAQIALRDPHIVMLLDQHLTDAHNITLQQGQQVVYKFNITAQVAQPKDG